MAENFQRQLNGTPLNFLSFKLTNGYNNEHIVVLGGRATKNVHKLKLKANTIYYL